MIARSTKLEKAVLRWFRNSSVNCVVTDGKITQLSATNDSIFMLALRLLLVQMHSFNLSSEYLNMPFQWRGRGKEEGKSPTVNWLVLLCLGFVLVDLVVVTSTTHAHRHWYYVCAKSSPDPREFSHL